MDDEYYDDDWSDEQYIERWKRLTSIAACGDMSWMDWNLSQENFLDSSIYKTTKRWTVANQQYTNN